MGKVAPKATDEGAKFAGIIRLLAVFVRSTGAPSSASFLGTFPILGKAYNVWRNVFC